MFGNRFGYGFFYGNEQEILSGMTSFCINFMGIFFVFLLAGYLLGAVGMYGMAKKRGITHGWLAFIPVASNYLLGELSGDIKIGSYILRDTKVWALIVPIIKGIAILIFYLSFMLSTIARMRLRPGNMPDLDGFFANLAILCIIIILCSLAVKVFFGLINYNVFIKYKDKDEAVLFLLLTMFVPLAGPIIFLTLSSIKPLCAAPDSMSKQASGAEWDSYKKHGNNDI